MMAKKTIYTNPPIERLIEMSPPMKFSQRLGEIVERYEILLKLTEMPELTDDEMMIMSEVICGSAITPTMVRSMHWSVLDAQDDKDLKEVLSKKIEQMSPVQRIKLIESLGH